MNVSRFHQPERALSQRAARRQPCDRRTSWPLPAFGCAAAWDKPRSGFTLIEVMISSALMALILVSAYLCLGA